MHGGLYHYIGWPHEPHPTYIDPTDCVPRQRKEQGDLPCAPESKPSPRRSTRWSPCSARSRPASCPASSGGLGRELLRHLGDQDDNQEEEEEDDDDDDDDEEEEEEGDDKDEEGD